jgi:putative ABC transport system permease protein
MKYLFKLAMKNIIQAKRRTILTFMILSFGIMLFLILASLMEGFDQASMKNVIDFEAGHFKIRAKSFDEDKPYNTDNFLKNTDAIEAKLEKIKFIKGFTKRILFLSEIDNGQDALPVITIGVDPKTDGSVFTLDKFIEKGKFSKNGVLIGKELAKDLKRGIGDTVYLSFRSSQGMNNSLELEITGLINSGDPKVNNATVFIDFKKAKEYLDIPGATDISIKTDNIKKTDQYYKVLKKEITSAKTWDWKIISSDFAALMKTKKQSSNYILFFIVLIAAVGIINTLLMSVYEKRQEIGTLMAMGMTNKEIRNIFLIEGFTIGFLGCTIGLILGTLLNLYFIYVGIDFNAMYGTQNTGFNVLGMVKSVWLPGSYIAAFILSVGASVLASYYPAKKVMKMSPVECLRSVQ